MALGEETHTYIHTQTSTSLLSLSSSAFPTHSKPLFIADHIIHYFNLAICMYAKSGLAIVFYHSHSELRNAPTLRKLEWLVYHILLFTLCAPSDDPTYNSTIPTSVGLAQAGPCNVMP